MSANSELKRLATAWVEAEKKLILDEAYPEVGMGPTRRKADAAKKQFFDYVDEFVGVPSR